LRTIAARIVVALVVSAVLTMPLHAQRKGARRGVQRGAAPAGSREAGVHVGYNFDLDRALIGAQATFPITRYIGLYPSFDYYMGTGAAVWALNFDLKLRPPAVYQFWYGGAGLNLLHAGMTTSHLNLFAGFAGRPGPFRPYAEGRLTLGDGSAFQLLGGLSFPLR
jgi:hypothetical protein